jgi:O-antigen/teichoic acid export membrane protein
MDVLDTSAAGGLVVRGGVLRFASFVAVVGLSVISATLLIRHLGPERFGQYTTVLSLVNLVALVTDAGMSNYGIREFAVLRGAERERMMRDLLGLRLTLTLVGLGFTTAFALAVGYSPALLAGAVAAGTAIVALVFQHTLSIPLTTNLRLGWIALLDFGRQALTVATIVVLLTFDAGLLALLSVNLLVNVLLIPATAVPARGQISLRMELRPHHWITMLRLTVAFSLATAVGTIYIYTAQILTSLVASPHQSGLFAASFRVFIVAAAIPGLLIYGALPLLARAARDDRERLAYALGKIFEVSLILGVGATLGLFCGAGFIMEVVAGPQFAGAAEVLRIQGLAMTATFVLAGWSFALISLQRYRGLLLANAAALAVSCAMTLTLASTDGARGAALATICGEATLAVGSLVALLSGHPELRPPLSVVPKVVLAALPGVALALASNLSSFAQTLLALAAYALLIALMRTVPEEITQIVPRPWRASG